MGKLFENSGSKIKTIAKIFLVIGIIGSIALAIILGRQTVNVLYYGYTQVEDRFDFMMFLCILVGGILISYISSLILHGFGELVENSEHIRSSVYSLEQKERE